MSNEKTKIRNLNKSPLVPADRGYGVATGARLPASETTDLEIDENDDFGGDPYNRTGSHCILKLGDDA